MAARRSNTRMRHRSKTSRKRAPRAPLSPPPVGSTLRSLLASPRIEEDDKQSAYLCYIKMHMSLEGPMDVHHIRLTSVAYNGRMYVYRIDPDGSICCIDPRGKPAAKFLRVSFPWDSVYLAGYNSDAPEQSDLDARPSSTELMRMYARHCLEMPC